MPSPLGHALAGLLVGEVGSLGARAAAVLPSGRVRRVACVAAAVLPDVDFLWGRHNMETHSLGAAVLAGLAVLLLSRGRARRLAVLVTVAWASHALLDWLGSDDAPPLGVMALWPFSIDFYFGHLYLFDAISRQVGEPDFWRRLLRAVAREVVILGPLAGAAAWLARRRHRHCARGH